MHKQGGGGQQPSPFVYNKRSATKICSLKIVSFAKSRVDQGVQAGKMHHHRSTPKNGCTTIVLRLFRSKIYLVTQKNVTLRSNLQKAALLGRDQGSPLSAHINFMAEKFVSSKVTVVPNCCRGWWSRKILCTTTVVHYQRHAPPSFSKSAKR